ncbi:MAG: hypothetical protein R3F61_11395 [Myxococcota bacterium]
MIAWIPLASAADDPVALVHTLEQPVAEVRGLAFREPVSVRVSTPREAVDALRERLTGEWAERLRLEGLALRAFGLAGPDFSYTDALASSLETQIGGFWEPYDQVLVVVARDDPRFPLASVVQHELVHALQDQTFDIGIKVDQTVRNDDVLLAFELLMEGDATYTDLLATHPDLDALDLRALAPGVWPESPVLVDAGPLPSSELESILVPYTLGAEHVQRLHRTGGWAAVNAAFTTPAASTEQILHPDRASDLPMRIALDPGKAAGPGFHPVYESSVGELNLALAFRQIGRAAEAWDLAAGWDGDRYVILEDDAGAWCLVWRTVWDTEQDAAEFASAAEGWLRRADPHAVIDPVGTGVVAVVGAPPGRSAKLVKAAWKAPVVEARDVWDLLGSRPTEARRPSTAP